MIFGWLIYVDLLVMFFSSKGDTPADTSDTRRNLSQIASLDQQLRNSVPPLGQAIHAASESVITSF